MFSFLKPDPTKKKEKQYYALLEKATEAQRAGNIKLYATVSGEAETLWSEIEALRNQS